MFLIAGVFHIFIGSLFIFSPDLFFNFAGIEALNYRAVWQNIGLSSVVFGVGYLVAYRDPDKHWLVVLLGLLWKVGTLVGLVWTQSNNLLPSQFVYLALLTEAIWVPFFAESLRATYIKYLDTLRMEALPLEESLRSFKVGEISIYDLSFKKPVLIIFLRHAGCAFCRETLFALSKRKIDEMTTVVVHMGRDVDGQYLREKFKLTWVSFVSDPGRVLYRSFGLRRGTFLQLFGPKVWFRGFNAAIVKGLGVGTIQGDGFQMPGAFVLDKGRVIYEERAESAGDQPNFDKLLCAQPANDA